MDTEKILEKVTRFVDEHENETVTAFQIAYETGIAVGDALNAAQVCVDRGILERLSSGDGYSVVPKEKRVSLQERTKQKMASILEKLSEIEIKFLQGKMDNHTRSEVNKVCNESSAFAMCSERFVNAGLFEKAGEQYKLALTEEEYLVFWDMMWDYPKKSEEKPQKSEEKPLQTTSPGKYMSIEEILAKRGITIPFSGDSDKEEETSEKREEESPKEIPKPFPQISEENMAKVTDIKWRALWYCISANYISGTYLQRKLNKKYGDIKKILEELEKNGYISKAAQDATNKREILISKENFFKELKKRFNIASE